MKCPNCKSEVIELKKFCKNCGYSFNFDDKWKYVQEHENLELQVLAKCGIIAVFIAIIFAFLRFTY